MAVNQPMWFANMQAFFGITQARKSCIDATFLSSIQVHTQVVAYEVERQRQATYGMHKIARLLLFTLHYPGCQQAQELHAFVFVQFGNGERAIGTGLAGNAG